MLARKMVAQWGMSDTIGPVTYSIGEEHPFLGRELARPNDFSEATARMIDEDVRQIITSMEENARNLLNTHRAQLTALSGALLEQETLDNTQLDQLLHEGGNSS